MKEQIQNLEEEVQSKALLLKRFQLSDYGEGDIMELC